MNERVKQEWINALVSGEYTQGHNYLRQISTDDSRYCCLGVLCDLYRKETNNGEWCQQSFRTSSGFESYIPPAEVLKWANLLDADANMLVVHNDRQFNYDNHTLSNSHSFTDIAFLIENYL